MAGHSAEPKSTGIAMLNVVKFRQKAGAANGVLRVPADIDRDIAEPACAASPLANAADEIRSAILMLDLASQQARQIARRMRDPSVRKDFDERLSIIEQLLQIAREKALKL
jgi:hypothetical protein